MRMCKTHWEVCRDAVKAHGLWHMVPENGEEVIAKLKREAEGDDSLSTFDPLMSLNTYFIGEAVRCGGVEMMGQNKNGENDGHYCPLCEFEKRQQGFYAKPQVDIVVGRMVDHVKEKL